MKERIKAAWKLTDLQTEVAIMVGNLMPNDKIMARLRIEEGTLQNNLGVVYRRLSLHGLLIPDEEDKVALIKALREFAELPLEKLLSRREWEISKLVAEGKRNAVIAQLAGINEITVKHHMTSIFNKTGFKNRTELAVHVIREFHSSAAPPPHHA